MRSHARRRTCEPGRHGLAYAMASPCRLDLMYALVRPPEVGIAIGVNSYATHDRRMRCLVGYAVVSPPVLALTRHGLYDVCSVTCMTCAE